MDYGRQQLLSILKTIDEEAAMLLGAMDPRLPVVIVGGSAFLIQDLTNRSTTHDIDVLAYHDALRDLLANYRAVNGAVAAYIDQIPFNFEDRLVRVELNTSTVDFFTPSVEDLAVMKLYGWRPSDQEDLNNRTFLDRVDWKLLDRLVYSPDEAAASTLSLRRYREMTSTYESYARRHGHEPHL